MTQAARRLTFEEYLNLGDLDNLPEGRCEFVDGELVELPPESRPNVALANYLFLLLVNAGIPFNLIYPHACEVEVPTLKSDDPRTRYPDLVILRGKKQKCNKFAFGSTGTKRWQWHSGF